MSYPLLPAAATSFVIASSFDAYVSIEVDRAELLRELLEELRIVVRGPVEEGQLVLQYRASRPRSHPPALVDAPPDGLLLLHAESRMPPENTATAEPPMNARLLIRCADAVEARIFKSLIWFRHAASSS